LIVDDHALFRKGPRTLPEDEDDMIVVGEAADGAEAYNQVRDLSPEIVRTSTSSLSMYSCV